MRKEEEAEIGKRQRENSYFEVIMEVHACNPRAHNVESRISRLESLLQLQETLSKTTTIITGESENTNIKSLTRYEIRK